MIELLKRYWALRYSRTAWAVVGLALLNGLESVKEQVPMGWQPYLSVILTLLALHFRANTKQVI